MGATEVVCSLKRGTRKRVKCDGKDYKRISEHVGKIPLVMPLARPIPQLGD